MRSIPSTYPWSATLIILLSIMSCQEPTTLRSEIGKSNAARSIPPTICILPLGKAQPSLVRQTANDLQKLFPKVRVLPSERMPSFAWQPSNKRWRADSLIHWMSGQAKADEVWIGITSEDISTTKGTFSDYGIMGLGYRPGRACIASNRRLKDKSNFFKVAIHELGHTAGLNHCTVNHCLMRNANGKDHTRELEAFCPNCRKTLTEKGWRL